MRSLKYVQLQKQDHNFLLLRGTKICLNKDANLSFWGHFYTVLRIPRIDKSEQTNMHLISRSYHVYTGCNEPPLNKLLHLCNYTNCKINYYPHLQTLPLCAAPPTHHHYKHAHADKRTQMQWAWDPCNLLIFPLPVKLVMVRTPESRAVWRASWFW